MRPNRFDERLGAIIAFVAVANRLSFSDAAGSLGMTVSTVSRKVSRLEEDLSVRLFNRTTRRVSLTEIGEVYYRRCVHILSELEDADDMASAFAGTPRGTLRVSVPAMFGRMHVTPAIPEFLQRYPEINLEISLTDHRIDLVEDNTDVVIRIGQLEDSRLIARRIATSRRLLVAAPGYLLRRGMPLAPADLREHDCLNFDFMAPPDAWRLECDKRVETIPIVPRLKSNTGEALLAGVLGGCGVSLLATWIVGDEIQKGNLVKVLPGWTGPTMPIHLAYLCRRHLAAKIRAFADFFSARFGEEPYWERGLDGAAALDPGGTQA